MLTHSLRVARTWLNGKDPAALRTLGGQLALGKESAGSRGRRGRTLARFPKTHLALVAALALSLVAIWMFGDAPMGTDTATDVQATPSQPPPSPAPTTPETPPTPLPLKSPGVETFIARVQPGDNLANIFKRHDLPARDLRLVIDSGPLGKRLENIFPGYEFEFGRDKQDNLVHLKYRPSRFEMVEFQRVGDRFEGSALVETPDEVVAYQHARIEHSVFMACQRVGLNDEFATRLAEIFGWDIDFILDIRKGDEFHVLYKEYRFKDKLVHFGDILAIEFVNQGDTYKAVRYERGTGAAGYYTPTGENMRKPFLIAPLEFSRISSNFNRKRVHPLWKSTVPHLGIDYAAPTGTPVKAAGAGAVVAASRSSSRGNYIVLKHGEDYETKYLHLSRFKRGIAKGAQVEQGEVIGFVGATGWATGPHLHYEFLVDGIHTNPRTVMVTLPKGLPIDSDERPRFDTATAPLLADLENRKENLQVAYLDTAH